MSSEPPLSAKILLVDDRPENLVALTAILQPLEQTLIRATSGEEALRQVLRHDFAVILLDVQMPGMNGFETASLIKSRPSSRHTPIIFLTAISKEEEYVFEGYSAGAVDYMFKPLNPDILRSKVSVFVDLYLTGMELSRQSELLRESERRETELRHQAELLRSEARFANIVDSARDAIITYADDRRITLFNGAAERIFRAKGETMTGQPVDALFRDGWSDEPPAGTEDAGRAAPDGGSVTREAVGVRKDGEEFPAEFSISSLVLGRERAHTLILRDVTQRRQAERMLKTQTVSLANAMEELRTMNEALSHRTAEVERAMGVRNRFYASMSHELRTPINAIMGYSSLLLDEIYGPLNERQLSSIERTHLAAEHLLELVNDILDLSKIEAGKMELHLEPVGFPELIEDLFVTVAPLAEQHDVQVSREGPGEPFTIVSDARRIRQIALNLLSNAIKFGQGKPVRVACEQGEDGGLRLEVGDEGPGIGAEDQERIFEEFVQLQEEEGSPGTGLGLSISRRLAELLGGSLMLESVPGEGSTFRLTLPPADPELLRTVGREGVAGGI